MIGSAVSILSGLAGIHGWFTGLKTGRIQEQLIDEAVRTRALVERLTEHILYVDSVGEVRDINREEQEHLTNRQNLCDLLAPIQRRLNQDILSTAVVVTPEKLKKVFAKDPWEVLIEIRPADRVKRPSNPDVVPIIFLDNESPYVGWQTRGAFPILFDCEYEPDAELYLPFGHDTPEQILVPNKTNLTSTSLGFQSGSPAKRGRSVDARVKEFLELAESHGQQKEKNFSNEITEDAKHEESRLDPQPDGVEPRRAAPTGHAPEISISASSPEPVLTSSPTAVKRGTQHSGSSQKTITNSGSAHTDHGSKKRSRRLAYAAYISTLGISQLQFFVPLNTFIQIPLLMLAAFVYTWFYDKKLLHSFLLLAGGLVAVDLCFAVIFFFSDFFEYFLFAFSRSLVFRIVPVAISFVLASRIKRMRSK